MCIVAGSVHKYTVYEESSCFANNSEHFPDVFIGQTVKT